MSNLPDKFTIPEKRIPKAFAQGAYRDCVAITLTKILEVINYVKTGEYIPLSKGYMYGRNNRPGKTQGGSDYDYMLNTLLTRGTVPEELCPERDEIPCIREKLEARADIAELDKLAEDYKIEAWEKIPGNAYKFENIKKRLYEHQMPIAGNMTGSTQHCTVIVGWDGDKLIYQDHNVTGKLISINNSKFNSAYYIDGGIEDMVKSFKSFKTVEEFRAYMDALKVTRSIKRVQLHHTYSPAYKHFTGSNHETLQKNMQNYHVNTNGWADIGQHFTIFPDGAIMTGRSMNSTPAGIYGANTGGICIECLGNFDKGGDAMTEAQKNAIVGAVKVLLDRFGLDAASGVTYHAWWTSGGTNLGTYVAGKSVKTCPGTNFFGGNSRSAFEKNLLPLIENYGKEVAKETVVSQDKKPLETPNDITWELNFRYFPIRDDVAFVQALEKAQKDPELDSLYWGFYKLVNGIK